jgi:hypothetical protein
MEISVILEQVNGNGYRATTLVPTTLVAEAPTRDEAVDKIQSLIVERLSHAELIQVTIPVTAHINPWLAIAGTWRDHPEIDQVQENIDAYRREVDADPDRL